MRKKILIGIACIIAAFGCFFGIVYPNSDFNNTIGTVQNIVIDEIEKIDNEVVITEEIQKEVNETVEATVKDEDISTTEIIESSEEEEKEVIDEGALETDAIVEQENISYDGANTGNGLSLLGAYQGLTYYSQADSRWANVMYSSVGNASQTMKSSACGPTSAAMIVSSSKGAILPTTMAKLSVSNGYRTANNGTAWSFYPFVADYFDFKEYYTTSNFDTAMNYLSQKKSDGSQKYYAIVSCGSGIWTSGGHYIVIAGVDGDQIKVYDPYLYNGKFNTASRRIANVRVEGSAALLTRGSFKAYSNYKSFFIYSNDHGTGAPVSQFSQGQTVSINAQVGICCYAGNRALIDNGETQFWIDASAISGNDVVGQAIVCWAEGGRILVQIGNAQFWTAASNLNKVEKVTAPQQGTTTKPTKTYSTGVYKTISNVNVRTGAGTNYKAKKSSQLTANARQQNARLGGAFNGYRKGVVCTVTKVSGSWGLTSSGWISLNYCQKQ